MTLSAPPDLVLAPDDRRTLAGIAAEMAVLDLAGDPEGFVLEAQVRASELSADLRRDLLRFRRFGHPTGGLRVRGVPVGAVPPTPTTAAERRAIPAEAAAALSVLVAVLGEQLGFRPELGGRLVQSIVPAAGYEAQQISLGSTTELELHVETAFSPYRADHLALLCLRPDPERVARTNVCSVDRMLPRLDPADVEVLRAPRFRARIDLSFRLDDGIDDALWTGPLAALEGPAHRPRLRLDRADMEGLDPEADAALDRLVAAALAVRLPVALEAGDLLLVDNERAAHGRTPFAPRYDGTDRWLLRAFSTRDLRRSEHVRSGDGRVVDAGFT